MSLESLKRISDEDEIAFLDILSIHDEVSGRLARAEKTLENAKRAVEIARVDYDITWDKYREALAPFLLSRRAYIAADRASR